MYGTRKKYSESFRKRFFDQIWLQEKNLILDCSSIAGTYNNSSINISYDNGNLEVKIRSEKTNQSSINIGKIRPSCDGHITFGDNEQKEFEFNEKKKEIAWTRSGAEDKWIGGCFC